MRVLKTGLLLGLLAAGLSACSSSSDTALPDSTAGQSDPLTDPTPAPTDPLADPIQDPLDSPTQDHIDPQAQRPADQPDNLLVPDVSPGSDLDRLLRGVRRQVSTTLLTLNQRLSSGELLSEAEEACLGAYDPALGEQLLAIDCAQAIAVGDSILRVGAASYYATSACNSSVSEGSTENCQLQSASLDVPIEWTRPATGLPQPIYPGSRIAYAIGNELVSIESLTDTYGAFRCDVALSDVTQMTTPVPGQSCSAIIKAAADRLDGLLPEE